MNSLTVWLNRESGVCIIRKTWYLVSGDDDDEDDDDEEEEDDYDDDDDNDIEGRVEMIMLFGTAYRV